MYLQSSRWNACCTRKVGRSRQRVTGITRLPEIKEKTYIGRPSILRCIGKELSYTPFHSTSHLRVSYTSINSPTPIIQSTIHNPHYPYLSPIQSILSNLILGIKKIPQPLLLILILILAILILAISSCRLSTTIISLPRRSMNSILSRRQRS